MKKPISKLVGEKVILGPIMKQNLETYVKWINDIEVSKYLNILHTVMTIEGEENWYEKKIVDDSSAIFSIYDKKTGKLIGNTSLENINKFDRTATFGIIIGEKDYWGKGYGTEATRLIIDFGFNVLNLNNIRLEVFSYNKRGIKAYEKVGFKQVGWLRQARTLAGKKYDVLIMDIIPEDFEPQKSIIKEMMKNPS